MEINADTKIAPILKAHPEALEAIVSISPRFKKLRNPVLRKMIAARTTIRTAARIGNCSPADFYSKLSALGFTIDLSETNFELPSEKHPNLLPVFLKKLSESQCKNLDVRPLIENDEDPLSIIMQEIKKLPEGYALKIINSFEPTPLIVLLKKKGFSYHVENITENELHTYFFKTKTIAPVPELEIISPTDDWDAVMQEFEKNVISIDVRSLPMPGPMQSILQTLNELKPSQALFVHHKRVPVFLLPELVEKGFEYRIKTISDTEVFMLIFKT